MVIYHFMHYNLYGLVATTRENERKETGRKKDALLYIIK